MKKFLSKAINKMKILLLIAKILEIKSISKVNLGFLMSQDREGKRIFLWNMKWMNKITILTRRKSIILEILEEKEKVEKIQNIRHSQSKNIALLVIFQRA